jgi:hypothetical protein
LTDPKESGARRGNGAGDDGASLLDQRERLDALARLEAEVEALRETERDLEVRRIERDLALERAAVAMPAGLDRAAAISLAEAVLQAGAPDGHGPAPGGTRERDRLRAGHAALVEWLEAGAKVHRGLPRVLHLPLTAAALAVLWAAWSVHAVFLILLVPLGGISTFLSLSGQDARWLRLGAARRFQASGLAQPSAWEEVPVRALAGELAARLSTSSGSEPGDRREEGDPEASRRLEQRLAEAGLDESVLEGQTGAWLRVLGQAERAGRDLSACTARRKAVSRTADGLREGVFRYLSRRGAAPAGGRADVAALREALARLREP